VISIGLCTLDGWGEVGGACLDIGVVFIFFSNFKFCRIADLVRRTLRPARFSTLLLALTATIVNDQLAEGELLARAGVFSLE
jgi:hypothetical protein